MDNAGSSPAIPTMNKQKYYMFKKYVYMSPFAPYYDAYKGQVFEIVSVRSGGHVELSCISDSNVVVDGFVDLEDLITVDTETFGSINKHKGRRKILKSNSTGH